MKSWEFADHTADYALICRGKNLKDLFENCAIALRDSMLVVNDETLYEMSEEIHIKSIDLESLLIDFLRELLYRMLTEKRIPKTIKITNLTTCKIDVNIIYYNKFVNINVLKDYKAITYHDINIVKKDDFYETKIIIDT